jgi:hypothetical protein
MRPAQWSTHDDHVYEGDYDDLMPFGKYKEKQTIGWLLQIDPRYMAFLTTLDWFKDKDGYYYQLYKMIADYFSPGFIPPDSGLLERFQEQAYCEAFIALEQIEPDWTGMEREAKWMPPPRFKLFNGKVSERDSDIPRDQYRGLIRARWQRRHTPLQRGLILEQTIERNDAVVELTASVGHISSTFRLMIKVWPDLGDEYVLLLRQMKFLQDTLSSEHDDKYVLWSLLIEKVTATNATLERVRRLFDRADISIVLASEIEAKHRAFVMRTR